MISVCAEFGGSLYPISTNAPTNKSTLLPVCNLVMSWKDSELWMVKDSQLKTVTPLSLCANIAPITGKVYFTIKQL